MAAGLWMTDFLFWSGAAAWVAIAVIVIARLGAAVLRRHNRTGEPQ